jgi:preprotein translocase subunit SecG
MLLTFLNVIYVLVAIGMTILILLQSGSGAQAGSGFGGGASATVFGARGATTFLSRATAVLAGAFFVLSIIMGIYVGHPGTAQPGADLGIMGAAVQTPAVKTPTTAPAAPTTGDVPKAPAAAGSDKPAPTPVPAAAPEKKDGGTPDAPKKN